LIGRELLFSALLPCQFRLPLSQVINAIPLSTYHRASETVYSSAFQTGDRLWLTYHLICHLSPITVRQRQSLHINGSLCVNRSFNRG